ncbi:hypothetical protein D3Z60_21370 [Lachnospiraceae bacterium]|jgi:beta-glucosidase|nr:hypothetical protein [Lachnospiraceae bacterium]
MNVAGYEIPNGPEDKPFLFIDPKTGPVIQYDIYDRSGHLYMLDHDFEGCVELAFSKPVRPETGKVTIDGKPAYFVVKKVKMFIEVVMLGIRLRGKLTEYGQEVTVQISSFVDYDGNTMEPLELTAKTQEKPKRNPKYIVHEQIALQAAEEGIVLLRNKGNVLPLEQDKIWNVFGKGIYDFRVDAVGAGKINPRYTVDFREAVNADKEYALNHELEEFYRCDEDKIPGQAVIDRAKQVSDTAIFLFTRASGENMDNSTARGEFYLLEEEEKLLGRLRREFAKLVVVLNVGYPVAMKFVDTYDVDAVVYCGFGGMLAGEALLNVLSGRVNPSGRLPDTWVKEYDDLPSAGDFYDCSGNENRYNADSGVWIDTVYREDIFVGYRYFSSFHKTSAYPFGFGLSYSSFQIVPGSFTYEKERGVRLTISVKNTGEYNGKEVVQVYVRKPDGDLKKADRELVEYAKTKELAPGETQLFTFEIPKGHMTSYDEKMAAYVMEHGTYTLLAGNSSENLKEVGNFILEDDQIIRQVKNRMQPVLPLEECVSGIKENAKKLEPERETMSYPVRWKDETEKAGTKLTFSDVLKNEELLETYISGLTVPELIRLAVCAGDGWGMEGIGEAGRIYQLEEENIPQFVVADGNSGVNLRKPNIGMPSGATICASFNRELAAQIGQVIGEEAKELGVDLILAPAFNIHRNPLCGRQPEYFSEDPYLAGTMAAYYCRGLEKTGVGGCYKHLAANNAEASRKRNQSILSERAFREIYFKAFEIALEEYEPVSIMTAYNAVNGKFTSEDPDLILGLLREESGFEGFVMTDWGSYDTADVVCMENAGNTWITPGGSDNTYTDILEKAAEDGSLDLLQLRENIWYMLRTVLKLNRKKEAIYESN